ncbi:uncharacterized protein NPIL_542361 [Nephila pilipes]|uniref:Uncharacterized protein n=1 Tax=Nephila pilipes TaxID=299642 RepID=A0A8X6U1H6_NEPPI|nr:uncharacterized protein NPIL_542361 [Nephila pilipes]
MKAVGKQLDLSTPSTSNRASVREMDFDGGTKETSDWLLGDGVGEEGNPNINSTEEIDSATEELTKKIHTAIDQSSTCKKFPHAPLPLPAPIRTLINTKNRLRKRWQESSDPNIKKEVNKLKKAITKILKNYKNEIINKELEEANTDDHVLHKTINKFKKKPPANIPALLGYRGLIYDTAEKANLFVDNFEESFQENPTPYSDSHIELVERKVRRYFNNNIQTPTPPHLT